MLADSLGPESSDDDGGAPDPHARARTHSPRRSAPQTLSQQPVGGVGRVPEAVARANDSEHDRVESYVSEAWTGEAPTRARQQQCMELSPDVVNTMTVRSDEANKIATVPNNFFQFKIPGYVLNRGKYK